jgi:pilus assembly protein Flp/PilA
MAYLTKLAATYFNALRGDEEGVTAIEYGLIAGAIAVAIIAVLLALGGDIANLFSATSAALQQASGS